MRWVFRIIIKCIHLFNRPEWGVLTTVKDNSIGGMKRTIHILKDSKLMEQVIFFPENDEIKITSIIADVKIISRK